MTDLTSIKLDPLTKRGKQLINEHGEEWLIIERSISLPCFDGASGILVVPVNDSNSFRWIRDDGSPNFNIQKMTEYS